MGGSNNNHSFLMLLEDGRSYGKVSVNLVPKRPSFGLVVGYLLALFSHASPYKDTNLNQVDSTLII
jgi:hypothetical protein